MGKYIFRISGTDRKSEIISESYCVDDASNETHDACIALYKEEWSCYDPHNISVAITDVEALYKNFKPSDSERVKMKRYTLQKEAAEREANERALYESLKQKYEEQ